VCMWMCVCGCVYAWMCTRVLPGMNADMNTDVHKQPAARIIYIF